MDRGPKCGRHMSVVRPSLALDPVGRLSVGLQVPLHLQPDGDVHLHEPKEEVHLWNRGHHH